MALTLAARLYRHNRGAAKAPEKDRPRIDRA
jgi:hypothetical protein